MTAIYDMITRTTKLLIVFKNSNILSEHAMLSTNKHVNLCLLLFKHSHEALATFRKVMDLKLMENKAMTIAFVLLHM